MYVYILHIFPFALTLFHHWGFPGLSCLPPPLACCPLVDSRLFGGWAFLPPLALWSPYGFSMRAACVLEGGEVALSPWVLHGFPALC